MFPALCRLKQKDRHIYIIYILLHILLYDSNIYTIQLLIYIYYYDVKYFLSHMALKLLYLIIVCGMPP